jgi:hypothetical protein
VVIAKSSSLSRSSSFSSSNKRKRFGDENENIQNKRFKYIHDSNAFDSVIGLNALSYAFCDRILENLEAPLYDRLKPKNPLDLVSSVKSAFDFICDWLKSVFEGKERTVLFVIGKTGSGKTSAIHTACEVCGVIAKTQNFDEYVFPNEELREYLQEQFYHKEGRDDKFSSTFTSPTEEESNVATSSIYSTSYLSSSSSSSFFNSPHNSPYLNVISRAGPLVNPTVFSTSNGFYKPTKNTVLVIDNIDTIDLPQELLRLYCDILFRPEVKTSQIETSNAQVMELFKFELIRKKKAQTTPNNCPIIITATQPYHKNIRYMMRTLGDRYKKLVIPSAGINDIKDLATGIFSGLMLAKNKASQKNVFSDRAIQAFLKMFPSDVVASQAQGDLRVMINTALMFFFDSLRKKRSSYEHLITYGRDTSPTMLDILPAILTNKSSREVLTLYGDHTQNLVYMFWLNYPRFFVHEVTTGQHRKSTNKTSLKSGGVNFIYQGSMVEIDEISKRLSDADLFFSAKECDFSLDSDYFRNEYINTSICLEMRDRFGSRTDKIYWNSHLQVPTEQDYDCLKNDAFLTFKSTEKIEYAFFTQEIQKHNAKVSQVMDSFKK